MKYEPSANGTWMIPPSTWAITMPSNRMPKTRHHVPRTSLRERANAARIPVSSSIITGADTPSDT